MQVESPDKIRNLALVGHNDTGKTTLVGAALYTSGISNRLNRVEDGNATTDFDAEEIERQISIGVATAFASWKQHKINLIDCPGYGIFQSEIQSGLQVADAALVCVNAASGIEVMTEKVWQLAADRGLPVAFHLTKMDRERAAVIPVAEALQKRFGRGALPVQLAIGKEAGLEGVVDLVHEKAYTFTRDGDGKASAGEIPAEMADVVEEWRTKLIEAVAESDEELMEKFFEDGTLSGDELINGLRKAIADREIYPITLSSAAHESAPPRFSTPSSSCCPRLWSAAISPRPTSRAKPTTSLPRPTGPAAP